MKTTTDLAVIRLDPWAFTWGKVLEIIDFGRYTVVKHNFKEGVSYHLYVDSKDTSTGFGTFDRAVVGAVAHGNLEVNAARWMAEAANKILGLGVD